MHPGPIGMINTEITPPPGVVARLPDLRGAYALARDVARMRPVAGGTKLGHRLVWARPNASGLYGPFGEATLFAHPVWDGSVVIGGHTQCGIVLPGDPFVTLRHL